MTAPVVTAVLVGFDSPTVHAVHGDRSAASLVGDRTTDTACSAVARAETRRGRRPPLTRTTASGGITCGTCRRALDSQRVPHA